MTFTEVANDPNVELAMSIAKAAGEQLLVRPEHLEIETKSSATDVVTQMDREAEAYIVAQLNKHRPDDAILGEEGANFAGSSNFQWVIDPIDGTVNYLHQIPHWCVSIGLKNRQTGESIAGVVYAPVYDQMYISSKGLG